MQAASYLDSALLIVTEQSVLSSLEVGGHPSLGLLAGEIDLRRPGPAKGPGSRQQATQPLGYLDLHWLWADEQGAIAAP